MKREVLHCGNTPSTLEKKANREPPLADVKKSSTEHAYHSTSGRFCLRQRSQRINQTINVAAKNIAFWREKKFIVSEYRKKPLYYNYPFASEADIGVGCFFFASFFLQYFARSCVVSAGFSGKTCATNLVYV